MASPVMPQVSTTIYFSDGNIVLDVVEDVRIMRFRVHKSLLSRHSDFFHGMFEIPQPPPNPSNLVDGCPVISLTGDSIKDWEIILDALYDPFFNQNQSSASTIIAMLRLGKKYQFLAFLKDAEHRLRHWYPSSLPEFLSRERQFKAQAPKLLEVLDEGILPDDILPVLYYDHLYLLRYLDFPGIENHATTVNESLSLRLLIGHRRLVLLQSSYIYADLHCFLHECDDVRSCMASLKEVVERISSVVDVLIISPFITLKDFAFGGVKFCYQCELRLSAELEAGALKVWNLMPWCFRLGSWKVLGHSMEEDGEESEDGDD